MAAATSAHERRRGDASRRRLLAELARAEARAVAFAGKVRIVVRDDALDVWDVQLSFEMASTLGMELEDHERCTGCPAHLLLELDFPPLYPADPPTLRIVRPRILERSPDPCAQCFPPTPSDASAVDLQLTFGGVLCLPELAIGRWGPHVDLAGLLLEVHERLLACGVRLDMASVRPYCPPPSMDLGLNATFGLPTVAKCVSRFPVAHLEQAAGVFPELAGVPQGRIVLPHECASEVYMRAFAGGSVQNPAMVDGSASSAVHVELKNPATGGRAFAGLAETFAPQDSVVFAPRWIVKQLFLRQGDEVRVRIVTLPLCAFVRLQPHTRDFYEVVGSDAKMALQAALAPLPTLTAGLSIPVEIPCAGNDSVVRQMPVFIARLEDANGTEILAAKMPAQAGILGDIEVRVDFLAAADLEESGKEYKERIEHEISAAKRVQRMAEQKRARRLEERKAAALAAAPGPLSKEVRARLGDGIKGFELCFRLPNGRQLRRRFSPDLTTLDLKMFLLGLREEESPPWRPALHTEIADLLLSSTYPRRDLTDEEAVSAVGDRSVVLVVERQGQLTETMVAAADTGIDAVLYPASFMPEDTEGIAAGCYETSSDAGQPALPFQHILTDAAIVAMGTPACSCLVDDLERQPEHELRALALSIGVSAADVARAVDSAELASLIARGQAAIARVNSASQHRTMAAAEAGTGQGRRVTPTPLEIPSSLAGGAYQLTEAQLAALDLTASQFLNLPADTREAILGMACISGAVSPASSVATATLARTISSASSSRSLPSRPPTIDRRPGHQGQPRPSEVLTNVSGQPLVGSAAGRRSATTSPRRSSGGRALASRTPSPSSRALPRESALHLRAHPSSLAVAVPARRRSSSELRRTLPSGPSMAVIASTTAMAAATGTGRPPGLPVAPLPDTRRTSKTVAPPRRPQPSERNRGEQRETATSMSRLAAPLRVARRADAQHAQAGVVGVGESPLRGTGQIIISSCGCDDSPVTSSAAATVASGAIEAPISPTSLICHSGCLPSGSAAALAPTALAGRCRASSQTGPSTRRRPSSLGLSQPTDHGSDNQLEPRPCHSLRR